MNSRAEYDEADMSSKEGMCYCKTGHHTFDIDDWLNEDKAMSDCCPEHFYSGDYGRDDEDDDGEFIDLGGEFEEFEPFDEFELLPDDDDAGQCSNCSGPISSKALQSNTTGRCEVAGCLAKICLGCIDRGETLCEYHAQQAMQTADNMEFPFGETEEDDL